MPDLEYEAPALQAVHSEDINRLAALLCAIAVMLALVAAGLSIYAINQSHTTDRTEMTGI